MNSVHVGPQQAYTLSLFYYDAVCTRHKFYKIIIIHMNKNVQIRVTLSHIRCRSTLQSERYCRRR